MIEGALAAAVTPLREDGETLDEEGFEPLAAFLAASPDAFWSGSYPSPTTPSTAALSRTSVSSSAENINSYEID